MYASKSSAQGIVVLLVVSLLCSLFAGAAVAGVSESPEPADVSPDDFSTDQRHIMIEIDDSGDAHWTVEHRMLLTESGANETYHAIKADIEENPDEYEEHFSVYMNAVFVSSTEMIDRDMSVENRTLDTREIRNAYGVIQYQFTWTNFSNVTQTNTTHTITAGDAISHLRIGADTRITLNSPEEYSITEVTPPSDNSYMLDGSVTWEGPIEFESDDEPRVVFEKSISNNGGNSSNGGQVTPPGGNTSDQNGDGTNETNTITNGDGKDPSATWGGGPHLIIAILLGVLGLTAVVLAWTTEYHTDALRRVGLTDSEQKLADTDEGASGSNDSDDPASTDDDETPQDANTETMVASDPSDDEDDGTGEDTGETSDVDFELLSNEEQVFHLLDEHEGRMKQKALVEETGWSPAKTSNVVNDMKDDGQVDVFRLGRENVVSRPDGADSSDIPST